MFNERDGYPPLLDLCEVWAKAASAPKELVLRRVIEWAVEGTFPPEAFLTTTGDAVPPLKMLTAFRALYNPGHVATWPASASYVAPTVVGSLSLRIPPDEAINVLADVVVAVEGVRRFCERVQITQDEPPPPCPRLEELEATDFRSTSESPDQVDQPPATRSRGRPPGSGSFAPADEPLVDEMRKILVPILR